MRRILIDRARQRLTQRRGGRHQHIDIDDMDLAELPEDSSVIRVNAALEKFEAIEPEKAQLVSFGILPDSRSKKPRAI